MVSITRFKSFQIQHEVHLVNYALIYSEIDIAEYALVQGYLVVVVATMEFYQILSPIQSVSYASPHFWQNMVSSC